MAIVEVIGSLFRELATSPDIVSDSTQTERQLNGLYDLLLERTLDLSSYVRAKVLSVLSKLCDLPVKFPKQRLAVTRAAVAALEDKAAGVRKGAVMLLVRLVVTHPYGLMHGGLLGLEEWEERYRAVKEELEKVEGGLGKAIEGEGKEEEEEYETDTDTDEDENGDKEGEGNGEVGEVEEEMEEFSVARTPVGLKTPMRFKTPKKTPRRMQVLSSFPVNALSLTYLYSGPRPRRGPRMIWRLTRRPKFLWKRSTRRICPSWKETKPPLISSQTMGLIRPLSKHP
jgi:hypothetical protein